MQPAHGSRATLTALFRFHSLYSLPFHFLVLVLSSSSSTSSSSFSIEPILFAHLVLAPVNPSLPHRATLSFTLPILLPRPDNLPPLAVDSPSIPPAALHPSQHLYHAPFPARPILPPQTLRRPRPSRLPPRTPVAQTIPTRSPPFARSGIPLRPARRDSADGGGYAYRQADFGQDVRGVRSGSEFSFYRRPER